ncbi:hypothetical protein BHE90_006282 [Fusarium euwallaceae]|uniref:Uncharacterized protein n=1 Tax=Fusarium euwallaceae TaxID=1147111 RepID=A0A430LU52_9HYPO|nr:hypothetical protein BHE90_006282 [Fusarium euwallaceae]
MNTILDEYTRNIVAEADKVALGAEKMAQKMAQKAAKKAERMAQQAEKMAQEAERIAKKVSDDTEEFVRRMFGPGFHHPHDHFDNHDRRGPAPTSTINHHHHHHTTTTTATETSTATITSTSVATSATTITYVALTTSTFVATSFTTETHRLPGPTAVAASATIPTFNNAATMTPGEVFGYAATAKFWIIAFLLCIHCLILNILLYPGPGDPNTKSSTRPKPRASSLAGTEMDFSWLKSCTTTRPSRIFAILFCRIFAALYLLEGFWMLDTALRTFPFNIGVSLRLSNHWNVAFHILLAIFLLFMLVGGTGFCLYKTLDQQFTLDRELVMLEVPGNGPTQKDKKKPRHTAHGGRGRVETDRQSIESGSDGDWEKDGFTN